MAFPVLAAALLALGADRTLGAHVFDPTNGGAMLWQHLFWFFGHPEVYIIALPFFGIISEILPVFSPQAALRLQGPGLRDHRASPALSVTVWAHHMYATGQVLLPFFAFMTMLIAVPTGVKFFNWIGTMWRRVAHLRDPDAVVDRLPRDVPVRRPDRHHPVQPGRWTSSCPTPTSWWRTSTTWCSAPWCSRCSAGSTSGGRSSPAGCSTRRWARSTSGCCSSASTPRS